MKANVTRGLQEATAACVKGDWVAAKNRLLEVIDTEPANLEALNLLGVIAARSEHFEEAVQWLERLRALAPNTPAVHFNLGNVRQSLRQWQAATLCYDHALDLYPDYAEAHINRAAALLELGRPHDALHNLDAAIRLQPDAIDAWNNRGVALQALARWDEALACYARVLSSRPEQADVWNNQGIVFNASGRYAEALACYKCALFLQPRYAQAHYNRGNSLKSLEQWSDALEAYDRALAIEPNHAMAWNNRGVTLKALGRWSEALTSFERAIAAKSDYAEAYLNRGNTLQGEPAGSPGALASSMASFEAAIRINPEYADAHLNLALCRLLTGDFKGGWPGYEWRWQQDPAGLRDFKQPLWQGDTPLHGKTILLHSEQGFGDTLQFCRYAAAVAALGARVILEVPPALMTLLHDLPGLASLVARGMALPDFDYHCPLLSLPLAFKTDLTNLPAPPAYLRADGEKVRAWEERLGTAQTPRIGLAWSGNSAHKNDRNRSLPLAELLAHLPTGLQYVSLQKEVRDADAALLQARPDILHFGELLEDFSDTAALCQCVDVIVSVDTSVAHLAGALGRPVWILLPSPPDWRWLLARTDSPWYPSATLYRQDHCGEWTAVLKRLGSELHTKRWQPSAPT